MGTHILVFMDRVSGYGVRVARNPIGDETAAHYRLIKIAFGVKVATSYVACCTEVRMQNNRVPPVWAPHLDPLAQEAGIEPQSFKRPVSGWCHYCGFLATTRDHIVPDSVGGVRNWWNLVPSCTVCNESKADRQSCSCMFCLRAIALWGLGFRHEGPTRSQRDKEKKARRKAREQAS